MLENVIHTIYIQIVPNALFFLMVFIRIDIMLPQQHINHLFADKIYTSMDFFFKFRVHFKFANESFQVDKQVIKKIEVFNQNKPMVDFF